MATVQTSKLSSKVFPGPLWGGGVFSEAPGWGALLGYSMSIDVLMLGDCKHGFSSNLTVSGNWRRTGRPGFHQAVIVIFTAVRY